MLKKDELIVIGAFVIVSVIVGLGLAIWHYETAISDIIPFLSKLPKNHGFCSLMSGVLGFMMIVVGNQYLHRRPFSTWVKDAAEPKVIFGACILGCSITPFWCVVLTTHNPQIQITTEPPSLGGFFDCSHIQINLSQWV